MPAPPTDPTLAPPHKSRVIVYIDGLNLFNRVLKGGPHKWLDLGKLFTTLRNRDDVRKVKYFTALIKGKNQWKQAAYLNALRADPITEVFLGIFKSEDATCSVPPPHCVAVMRDFYHDKEKQTDVGIGVEMVVDACENAFDLAVLVTGDTDLVPAVKKTVQLGKKVHVYIPSKQAKLGQFAHELRDAATTYALLPQVLFPHVHLPDSVDTPSGLVMKPSGW